MTRQESSSSRVSHSFPAPGKRGARPSTSSQRKPGVPGRPPGSLDRSGRCLRRVKYGEGWSSWAAMLGEQLQYIREERDISASELAAAIGVWVSTVHNWESGRCQPTLRRLKRVADALGVMAFDLLPRAGA